MKVTTLLTAAVLAFTPALAFAGCSGYGHSETANSCADGQLWDVASQSCVTTSTS